MADRPNERVVYFNGEIIPESRALVSFRDRSFRYGDGAFDTARTFGPSRLATASYEWLDAPENAFNLPTE
jgi:branched-subunit amino acid aminotransferase/4-amino-4-deoxychorismate lyase